MSTLATAPLLKQKGLTSFRRKAYEHHLHDIASAYVHV
jgi:hypothetical protein